MRVILKNSKAFFDEILLGKKLTLRKLSEITGWNYSNLKGYRRGELTMPEDCFVNILKFSPNQRFWIDKVQKIDDNWGSIKAGKISASRGDMFKRMRLARKFKKIVKVKIRLNPVFCEFYGALLGDGCISRFKDYEGKERYIIQLTGNLKLDNTYWIYLKNLLANEYSINCYYYARRGDNTCVLSIKNKGLCLELNKKFSMPIGLKYNKLKFPKIILSLPWKIKKFVLRGLFDTDGCIFARKDEGYRLPHISISSKSLSFREQICSLLREQGYPAYVNNSNVRIKGIQNTKKWFNDIGSSNSRNLIKYQYFLKHGFLPARLLGS